LFELSSAGFLIASREKTNVLTPLSQPINTVSPSQLSDIQEAIGGIVGGAVVSSSKVLVKHPLDTVSIRIQVAKRNGGEIPRRAVLLEGLWRGVIPPLVFAIPSGAVFFSVKDYTKSLCRKNGFSKEAATLIGVFVAQFPYWAIRNPSELLKTRAMVSNVVDDGIGGVIASTKAALLEEGGVRGLWRGYGENIICAFPADAVKFVVYEMLTGGRGKDSVPPLEGALAGAVSTAVSQIVTTPLDVVRNRAMLDRSAESGPAAEDRSPMFAVRYFKTLVDINREEGPSVLWAGLTPRIGKALLSGAIQFGSYELTKGSLGTYFNGKNAKSGV
jgi:hypothetical protein